MKKTDSISKGKTILNNGVGIPIFGLDTYNNHHQVVKFALKNVYTGHLTHTARFYGNHKIIAKAIKDSRISCQEIFIVSKIASINLKISPNFAYAKIKKAPKELLNHTS